MSYCLNPYCDRPDNNDDVKYCVNCGGKILIAEHYRPLKQIGQGGFGRTFLAIDEHKPSKPYCVIKQFYPTAQGTKTVSKAAELFEREAVTLDNLGSHPQIPDLYAYLTQDDRQYLIQEYIDGNNLEQELQEKGKFNESQILTILNNLLPLLDFIHNHHIYHRDIKPENIICRRHDGKLILVDFGAVTQENIDPAAMNTSIGTAEFAAPEQLRGNPSPASDIYSLGVTCIYLLTNTPAFQLFDLDRFMWVWREYLESNPVSDKLGKILDKMIEEKPSDRYQSAIDIIADLSNDHNPSIVPSSLTVSTPDHSSWQCLHTLNWHNKPINSIAISNDDKILCSADQSGTIVSWNLQTLQPINTCLTSHPIRSIAISPDHQLIVSGDENCHIQIRHLKSLLNPPKECYLNISDRNSHNGYVYTVNFSPDGKLIISGGADHKLRLWSTEKATIIHTFDGHNKSVTSAQIFPNGKIIVSGSADGIIKFWSLEQRQLLKTINAHSQAIHQIIISRDGRRIITASGDRTVKIWDLQSGNSLILSDHQDQVLSVAISTDNNYIASGSLDSTIKIWDSETGTLQDTLIDHRSAIKSLAFNHQGQLISGSWDKTIKIYGKVRFSNSY